MEIKSKRFRTHTIQFTSDVAFAVDRAFVFLGKST